MLEARKPSIWRNRYELLADGEIISFWEPRTWRNGGSFVLAGCQYTVSANTWGTQFQLIPGGGPVIATASRVGRKHWTVEALGRTYHFQRTGFWRPEEMLIADGRPIGTIRRTGYWQGDVTASLPGLPLPIAVFVLVVVLTNWDSQAAAAASV